MQYRLGLKGGNALGERCSAHQVHGVVGVVAVVDLGATILRLNRSRIKYRWNQRPMTLAGRYVMSQHHTWPGAVAMWVVGGRVALGALARPRRAFWPCARSTRAMLDSPRVRIVVAPIDQPRGRR